MFEPKPILLSWKSFWVLFLIAVTLASFYRFTKLDNRPLHVDEAILFTKSAGLIENGYFKYDPTDFHGPFFHQCTQFWSKLNHWPASNQWAISQLRQVPVATSLLLFFIPLLSFSALRRVGYCALILLIATSPLFCFYNRYYIMETLLVVLLALSLAFVYQIFKRPNPFSCAALGASLGLAHATKETFIIHAVAGLFSYFVAYYSTTHLQIQKAKFYSAQAPNRKVTPKINLLLFLLAFLFFSVFSFTQGFQDWQAVKDSILTYQNYFIRTHNSSGHEKPFYYYLSLLIYHHNGTYWTEGISIALAFYSIIRATFYKIHNSLECRYLRFLTLYTLLSLLIYSIIPYKTPWSILPTLYGFFLLAALALQHLWDNSKSKGKRFCLRIAFGLAIYHSCLIANHATNTFENHPRNPYLYSHSSPSIKTLVQILFQLKNSNPLASLHILQRDNGWPLPWYLRTLKETYFYPANSNFDSLFSSKPDAKIWLLEIPPTALPENHPLRSQFFCMDPILMRNNVPVYLYISLPLWHEYQNQQMKQKLPKLE